MVSKVDSKKQRQKRHLRVRGKLSGTAARPRLCVNRSLANIYVQVIDDEAGKTLCAASSTEKDFAAYGGNKAASEKVGEVIAKRALEKGVTNVVFDRAGFVYTGRVKALAEAARKAGLQF